MDQCPPKAVGQRQDFASKNAEGKCLTGVTMLDQTGSFDMVDHKLLLVGKMALYKFTRTIIKWFASYFRCQRYVVPVESK